MAKVLVIEDDPQLMEVIPIIIESQGHKAVVFPSNINVTDVDFIKPDVILFNKHIADEERNLCLEIKTGPRTEIIPVILLSVLPTIEDLAAMSKADGYQNAI